MMLHAGLDLGRRRIGVCLLSGAGEVVDGWASPPDADGLRGVAARAAMWGPAVGGVIESMNGARLVRDRLEEHGWEVLIADAAKVKGLAPLACKADRIDARVLAACRGATWWRRSGCRIGVSAACARSRGFRLRLVRHRATLKNRVHAALIAFGHPCPVSDLFGPGGRVLLDRMQIPGPVAGQHRRSGCSAPWRLSWTVSAAIGRSRSSMSWRLPVASREQRSGAASAPLPVAGRKRWWLSASASAA